MKVFNHIVLIAVLLTFAVSEIAAREHIGAKPNPEIKAKAAGCSPAQSFSEFYVNNVRTAAETGGNTWYDRGNGKPYYEVPAGEGNHALFAGALWMGGEDPAGNLKLAAIRFRQRGNDFWPGPLTVDGTASIEAATCTQWDGFFNMSKQMVETHRYYFTLVHQGLDPMEDPLFADMGGYEIPKEILDWPAHGNVALGQSYHIAPFMDFRDPISGEVIGEEGVYEPELGDYPLYDLDQEIDCRTRLVTDPVPLFGDYTMYWVFNDKGNVHSESEGQPIGMEIQAQMFGFTTNDEINNMTFCNYVLINRGTLTLNNTYFAQWVDPDLGNYSDDYIGCDVERGLGYAYNGEEVDESSQSGPGYGALPPAIGIDFFEGPYQDADGINNKYGIGHNEALNGLGYMDPRDSLKPYGIDTIIDNERYGMRRFLFHNNDDSPTGDPVRAVEYYRMMQGIWRNGVPMTYGGTGYNPTCTSCPKADFMFPGDSDPLHWGTQGVDPNYAGGSGQSSGWTEEAEGNPPGDRRFIQSAGPFTLQPGQFNNITVGVVYARAQAGTAFSSVKALLQADDKAQALFENCFRLLSGPDAPDLTAQGMDREIILYLSNTNPLSNNKGEGYQELDPTIPPIDDEGNPHDQFYRFQGYQVYQLKHSGVSVSDIDNENLARLVYQGDIVDFTEFGQPIGQLVNYEMQQDIGLPVPREMVNGANEGIQHSIKLTTDRFASGGDNRLVNFKKYYYVAVAYAYNSYEEYNPDKQTGQARPYLRGRSSATGDIQVLTVIPSKHKGKVVQSKFGDGVEITRIEGTGNGGNDLELNSKTIDRIMAAPPYRADTLTYKPGKGPLKIKVIDPITVKPADFVLKFYNDKDEDGNYVGDMKDARWYVVDQNNPADTIWSETSIEVGYEQILPEYGISINIGQYELDIINRASINPSYYPKILGNGIEYLSGAKDWLTGVADQDVNNFYNWIKSGIVDVDKDSQGPCYILENGEIDPWVFNDDEKFVDSKELFEKIIGGTWAPARLALGYDCGPSPLSNIAYNAQVTESDDLSRLKSVDIYITRDKSRWSRSPVFEMQPFTMVSQMKKAKLTLRGALSVDKNGRNQLDPGANVDECTYGGKQVLTQADIDGMTPAKLQELVDLVHREYPSIKSAEQLVGLSFGMGWFPGFAVSPETGERLNIAFGENSYLVGDNGRDMLWNPSTRAETNSGDIVFGGEHYIYTFRNKQYDVETNKGGTAVDAMSYYDGGQIVYNTLKGSPNNQLLNRIYRNLGWVGIPLLKEGHSFTTPEKGLVPGDAKISLHVAAPYEPYATVRSALGDESYPTPTPDKHLELSENNWYPMYWFSTKGLESYSLADDSFDAYKNEILDGIDVVPNPYYAYSAYEQGRLENKVRFINLPERCKISIFTINGNLIRIFDKDNKLNYIDWDLENETRIPISGGMYIIHVEVHDVGETTLKFFAATRPMDLRNF